MNKENNGKFCDGDVKYNLQHATDDYKCCAEVSLSRQTNSVGRKKIA